MYDFPSPKNDTLIDQFYMNLIHIHVAHVQCSIVEKRPFLCEFLTNLIPLLTFEWPPGVRVYLYGLQICVG